jgi:PAS domain S-box-containing protein
MSKHTFTNVLEELGAGGAVDGSLEDIRVPTYIIDRTGRVRWLNRRARELLGDMVGVHFTRLVAPESEARALTAFTKKLLGTAGATDYELTLETAAGAKVPVEIHSIAIGQGGTMVGVFGLIDVREAPPLAVGRAPASGLTPRQAEILQALARGYSTDQIAESLGIARVTVRNHVRGLLRALGVRSRLQAVVEARRRGLVDDSIQMDYAAHHAVPRPSSP